MQSGQKGKREAGAPAQSAKCPTVPKRHLCQVKALITSACLKHSDVTKLDNWIETSPTADHMCRCDVCDGSQDDGRRTVSEQSVQRITSKETAQT